MGRRKNIDCEQSVDVYLDKSIIVDEPIVDESIVESVEQDVVVNENDSNVEKTEYKKTLSTEKIENDVYAIIEDLERSCLSCKKFKDNMYDGNGCPFMRFNFSKNKILHQFPYSKWSLDSDYCSKYSK